ncbi:MAG: hypothetical protein M1834_003944 [Cirrosporium novae-zelandiae]|nr:MAG: hypothetical protein M1834_003944 [Cirrosporium novae-zelandiae]
MSRLEAPPRSPFSGAVVAMGPQRNVPTLPSSVASSESPSGGDPMDVTPPTSSAMGPPRQNSPEADHSSANHNSGAGEINTSNPISSGPVVGAAAAAANASQQPKVVQTAFIHKLYKYVSKQIWIMDNSLNVNSMLEDQSIQHLISWSANNDSFIMSPSNEFSKVLSQYFKHTNISSFVRQLNMYGFHKVSDVFHNGSPESPLWEFKHGNGNFKRGDLIGLREIKRRASRHALIHRESYPNHRSSISQPGTPAEPMPDTTEARLLHLEHQLFDMRTRLNRSEENQNVMNSKFQALADGLLRCHQWNHSLTHFLLNMVPDPENAVFRDLSSMERDITAHLNMMRTMDASHESLLSGRQPYFANMTIDHPPLSPRQLPQDDPRRPTHLDPSRQPPQYRAPVPAHLSVSPRRYGSFGGPNVSPGFQRSPIQTQPPAPHPLSSVSSPPGPNLARRHTSADIREHGWPPTGNSPFTSGPPSGQWPSSPNRTPQGDPQVQEVLSRYEINGQRQHYGSRQATPPLTNDTTPSNLSTNSAWSFGGPQFSKLSSAPPTRRSSMASNVHSLLNPADTAERPDCMDPASDEIRKRKRLV